MRACQGRYSPAVPPTRSLPLVALALAVAVIVVHAHVVIGGTTWDDVRYHTEIAPPRLHAAASVQGGELPAWWDGTGLGVSLAAEPSHGALYPPIWIASTPRLLDLVLLLHLLWAALGVAVWARRRTPPATTGVSDPAALVAGLLIATTGILESTALRGALPALAHLPWLGAAAAWLAEATARRARAEVPADADVARRDQARAAAAIAVLLGLVGLVGQLAVLVDAIVLVVVIAGRRSTVRWLAAALAGGLAIAAAQWIPALLQLGRGAGSEVTGLPLSRLIELIVPGSFGTTDPDRAITALAGTTPWAPSVFVGAPLLALAAVRTPSRRVLGVLATFAVLALGVGRGGWPGWLGAPELHLAALVIVLAANAGAGLDALAAGQRRAVLALAVAAGCSAVALAALAALRGKHPEAAPAIDRALLNGGLGLICMIAAIALAWRTKGRAMPILLALVVLPSVGARDSIAPTIARSIVDEPPPWVLAAEASPRPMRVYRPVFMYEHAETVEDAMATFSGSSGARWDISGARSNDPARLPDQDAVWLAAAREGGALIDRFGIALAILPSTMVEPRRNPKMVELGRRGAWSLTALPVAPIAAVLRGAQWAVDPGDATALLFAPGGGTNVLRGTVVLRGAGAARPDKGPPLPCTIAGWDDGDISLSCTSDVGGYAAISSSAAPGWSVTVDGRDTPWLTADVLRRAVEVPAGTHAVHWSYQTPGQAIGLLAAALGVLSIGVLLVANRQRARNGV
ncbi:MAG: hypothetical protein JWP01_1604 [Myxococcales bacterium]|nr:hypothetical protein [Myxococcales bacterium]